MTRIQIPSEIKEFALVFQKAGKKLFIVGGAVRDSLLGRPVSDYDAATDAKPEEVLELFRRVIPTGIKHGTLTVLWKGRSIETTTFRKDQGYSDGRRPDRVDFGVSLEEDLQRRDFTINAMAYDPLAARLEDPEGGREDLKRRLIRAVGDPLLRFREDGLRTLRALRFASQLDFALDPATFAAIPPALGKLESVSAERVRDEFAKILLSPRPSYGLGLMEKTGILALLFPELQACRGVEQKGYHRFDVLDHLYLATDAAPARLELRLAALFHDLGKPGTKAFGADGIPTFYRHEALSTRLAEAILRRLRLPNETIARVCHLIAQHMFHYEESWTDAALRRFLARVGPASLEDLLELRLADSAATLGLSPDPASLLPLRLRIEKILEAEAALGVKDLAVNGRDLAAAGIPAGPLMGKILADLLEAVLEDPAQNTKECLLRIAQGLKGRYGIE